MSEKKYIDLDNVIDKLEDEWGYQGMREELYDLPAADVREVRHGVWIDAMISENFYKTVCSECGGDIPKGIYGTEFHSDFCPHCGAKMDGGDEG